MLKLKLKPVASWLYITGLILALSSCGKKDTGNDISKFSVPVTYYKLGNGLKVVLSQDQTAPTVVTAVYYNIGFRIEPRNRTGFAHLFEHMMFQGSQNLGKMEFIKLVQKNGGVLNGSTRFDFTNYFEILPAHKLQTALWAEADRMKGLAINEDNLNNQKGVVTNEVKVNVLNQPYGGFPWLDMPQYANSNWYNAHNFYGDLADLDSAKLEDVQSFFKTYYAPDNAVLVVVGDFDTGETRKWIENYFGGIASVKSREKADITEPKQNAEKRFTKEDKLANQPAIAIAYHMPERNTPEYFAMGLIDQILLQGKDSKLYQSLVQGKGYTSNISGGINSDLGNMFDYNGPMLWMSNLIYDNSVSPDSIISVYDAEISNLAQNINQEMADKALIKMRSGLYDEIGGFFGVGRANLLACFALFDDNPSKINEIEDQFRKVTPELIRQTIKDYLQSANRTILIDKPVKQEAK
jgi:zinc protease